MTEAKRSPPFDMARVASESEAELLQDTLPFWLRCGVDQELGGFICGLHHDGSVADDSKFCWYQGRGIWVFARLFNHHGGDPRCLRVAKGARSFALRHLLVDPAAPQRGLRTARLALTTRTPHPEEPTPWLAAASSSAASPSPPLNLC